MHGSLRVQHRSSSSSLSSLFSLSFLLVWHGLVISGRARALVPLPANVSGLDSVPAPVAAGLVLDSRVPTLQAAFARLLGVALPQYRGPSASAGCPSAGPPIISLVSVTVANASEAAPQLGDDESYTLAVRTARIDIACARVAGCTHALTTLAQTLAYDFAAGCYSVPSLLTVSDAPRFAHRGVLLDTSRHFYDVPALLQLLDAMAAVKLNVFHWHLTDDQSFPLHVPGTRLDAAGAFDGASRYSAGDVAAVVEYARGRGIRVVPEIDTPGHSASWCLGHPEACVPCPGSGGLLDPSSNATYALIASVLSALRAAGVADDWVHLGGDEIGVDCWLANDTLRAWLLARHPGLSPVDAAVAEAFGGHLPRVQALARAAGFGTMVAWEDAFDFAGATPACGGVQPALPTGTVVHVFRAGWGGGDFHPSRGACGSNTTYTAAAAVAAGYRVVFMPPSSWYLSCYADHCDTAGGGQGFEPWQAIYAGEPLDGITDPAQQQLVLGGEAAVWSERLDAATMLPTVFPRLAAAAERLWSPRNTTDLTDARARLLALRARLLAWGLPASALDGGNEASPYGLPSRPPGPGPN